MAASSDSRHNETRGIELNELPTQVIDEKPWRYIGYKGFAAYVASDPDCFVVRRFDRLFARGILYKQDHLSELEKKLEDLDTEYTTIAPGETEVNNGTVRDDMSDRKELVHTIFQAQMDYYKMLLFYSELGSRRSALKRFVQNVRNWLSNHRGAISEEETYFVDHDEDLISVLETEQPTARRLFEDWVMRTKLLYPLFRKESPGKLSKVDESTLYFASNKRINLFSSIAIFMVGSVMFIAPLWILQALNEFRSRLLVITIFIFVFLAVLASATTGKPFEILAVTAGYSAVLVVFLQFGNPPA